MLALLCLLLVGLSAPAARALPSEDDLARLSAELALHPDDPALARALARAQLERGDADAAIATLRAFANGHPQDRPELAQLLGRALYEKGALTDARTALEEAIAHRDDSALGHFYLGLVLLRSGEREAASRELSRAVQLDPSLADSLRAASGEAPERKTSSWLSHLAFAAGTGAEYDTNPRLAGDDELASLPDTTSDFDFVYDATLALQVLRTERSAVTASYRFDQTQHVQLDELDMQSHGLGLGGILALGRRGFVRLDGGGVFQQLDHEDYLRGWNVGPSLGYAFERLGLLQLHGFAEHRDFAEEPPPLIPALERDGWRFGASLQHRVPVQLWAEGQLTTELQYARTQTNVDADSGIGAAFDSHFGGGNLGLTIPLGLGFRLDSSLLAGYERFDHENVVELITAEDPSPPRRRDTLVDFAIGVSHPLTSLIDFELRFRETRRFSNVGAYDSDRQLIGTYLHFRFDP